MIVASAISSIGALRDFSHVTSASTIFSGQAAGLHPPIGSVPYLGPEIGGRVAGVAAGRIVAVWPILQDFAGLGLMF